MTLGEFPEVRYARGDGAWIAYSVWGEGPPDLVRVAGVLNSILCSVVNPDIEAHNQRLSTFSRLIVFDRRGLGLSDPLLAAVRRHSNSKPRTFS